jgi:hypothetical protein
MLMSADTFDLIGPDLKMTDDVFAVTPLVTILKQFVRGTSHQTGVMLIRERTFSCSRNI